MAHLKNYFYLLPSIYLPLNPNQPILQPCFTLLAKAAAFSPQQPSLFSTFILVY